MAECERRTSDKAKGEVRVNGGLVGHLLGLQALASRCYTDSKYLPGGPVPCTCPGMFNCPRRRMQRTMHTVATSRRPKVACPHAAEAQNGWERHITTQRPDSHRRRGLGAPEIKLGESRGDLAVAPRNGIREGYPLRALSCAVGLARRNWAYRHTVLVRGVVPHDWAHSIDLRCQLTSSLTAPAPWRRLKPAARTWRGQRRVGLGASDHIA